MENSINKSKVSVGSIPVHSEPAEKNQRISHLEDLAKDVLKLKQELGQRKPLVIEFCGTPKSGKTTTINALNIFFKRNEFSTEVIQEMATISPIRNKTHYFFNSWTLFMSLAETIKQLSIGENKVDIILVDRSIFDALCWFEWLRCNPYKNPYIDQHQFHAFETLLVSTDMWTSNLDLVYIFKARPDRALQREFADLLTDKRGSIMNESVLSGFNDSIAKVKRNYSNKFRRIEEYDTTFYDPNTVSFDVTKNILETLREMLTEKIGYFLDTMQFMLKDGINDFAIIENKDIFFGKRDMVENQNYIQPVAIAVITNYKRDKVLVLKKNDHKTERTSPEYRRLLLYLGGHSRIEDKKEDTSSILEILKQTLHRELKEELNETITASDEKPILIYTPTTEKSKKHIAVCFIIEMDLENKSFRPTSDEFIFKSTSTKSGTVVSIKELMNQKEGLEPWSETILQKIFLQQKTLFD